MSQQSKNTLVNVSFALGLLILLGAIAYIFYFSSEAPSNIGDTVQIDTIPTKKHKVGEPLILEGDLVNMEDLASYTHTLTDDDGVMYGIKSTSKDLYTYSGKVSLKGKVVDIKKGTAILDVSEIISTTSAEDKEDLDANTKITYLPQLGLMIDLSQTNGYDIEVNTASIAITDTAGTGANATVLTINPFTCTPGESLKDCDLLLERFGDPLNEKFTSANNITYYNMTETNTWLAFNPRNVGYYFIPGEDLDIASFVDLISFLDNSTIKASATEFANTACVTLAGTIADISSDNISMGTVRDGLVDISIAGTTAEGYDMECTLQTRLGNPLVHTLKSATVQQGVEVADTENEAVVEKVEQEKEEIDEETEKEGEEEIVVEGVAKGTSKVNSLRIRSSKDIGDNILGAINPEDKITILEIEDERLKILFKNQEARVKKSFITIEGEETQVVEEVEIIEEETIEKVEEKTEEPEEVKEEEVKEEEPTETEEIIEEEAPTETEVTTPKTVNSGTSFSSSRGYTLFFSDKNIAYDGSTTNNLATGCIQKINVISRAQASNVNTNPDLVIQVCNTETDDAGELIGTVGSDSFYLQDLTGNLNMDITVSSTLEQ